MSLCMNCMCEKGDEEKCPFCGYEKKPEDDGFSAYLKENTLLNDRYIIGRVLGQGGFGITYVGYDTVLNRRIAIKEYYPAEISQRVPGTERVAPFASDNSMYEFSHGKEKFIDEARTLAKFSGQQGVVDIKDCFETGGTAYIIMEYLDGITLKEYLLRAGGAVDLNTALSILSPVMDALEAVHKVNIIHRDISPDNIFITNKGNNNVKLLDFGAARQSAGGSRSLSVLLKPGYAPEEQYRSKGNQGPWTDIYALCATMYRMLTGSVPPDSLERRIDDKLVIPDDLPFGIKTALRRGLAVYAPQRISSIAELRSVIENDGAAKSEFSPASKKASPHTGAEKIRNIKKDGGVFFKAGAAVIIALLAVLGISAFALSRHAGVKNSEPDTYSVSESAAPVRTAPIIQAEALVPTAAPAPATEPPKPTEAPPKPTAVPPKPTAPPVISVAGSVGNEEISDFVVSSLRDFVNGINNGDPSYIDRYFGPSVRDEEMESYNMISGRVNKEEIISVSCHSLERISDNKATVIRDSDIKVYYKDGSEKILGETYKYTVVIHDDGTMEISDLEPI